MELKENEKLKTFCTFCQMFISTKELPNLKAPVKILFQKYYQTITDIIEKYDNDICPFCMGLMQLA